MRVVIQGYLPHHYGDGEMFPIVIIVFSSDKKSDKQDYETTKLNLAPFMRTRSPRL
ncbi:hypothetical protein [Salinivibrio sp. ES.052]|uniref:hypothetical protein n=1 Tax=Salinivibrio sp. ES.052 TaxID=1882823 RepID=UPI0015882678|nr:hypothetical protein [Salinivibrio sp. ES.052]